MKSLGTIRAFAKAQGFKTISKVSVNTNGYKFVTFCKKDAEGNLVEPENIYLSINLGEATAEDAELSLDLPVYEVENEAGEKRIKIGSEGGRHMDLD